MIVFVKLDNYWATYIPYAFLHMGYHLKRTNIKYKILHNTDRRKFNNERNKFISTIKKLKPSFVGLSVITGRQAKDSAEFSIELKNQIPGIKILWGGIHPTLLPRQCINQYYIDYVLEGEADQTIGLFYNEFKGEKCFEKVPGCWWKQDGEVRHSNLPLLKVPPENIGFDFSEIDILKYLDNNSGLSIITSRGCPYNCQFCINQSINNKRWRPFNIDLIKDTIDFFKSKSIRHLHVNDDNFYVDFDRAVSILEYSQLPNFSEIRIPTILKDNRLKILEKVKSKILMSGAESCDNNILGKLKKGQTYEQMIEAAYLFKEHKKIKPSWSFIVGMPIENMDNIKTTFAGKIELDNIAERSIGPIGLYMPYPGSPLYDVALKKGFLEPNSPLDWVFERYGPKGRGVSLPDHNKFPWINMDEVRGLMVEYNRGNQEVGQLSCRGVLEKITSLVMKYVSHYSPYCRSKPSK